MSWGWDLLKDVERTFDKAIGIQEDDIGKISLASELEKVAAEVVVKATSLRSLTASTEGNDATTTAPTPLVALPSSRSNNNITNLVEPLDKSDNLDLESLLNTTTPTKETASPKRTQIPKDRARIVEDMRKLNKTKKPRAKQTTPEQALDDTAPVSTPTVEEDGKTNGASYASDGVHASAESDTTTTLEQDHTPKEPEVLSGETTNDDEDLVDNRQPSPPPSPSLSPSISASALAPTSASSSPSSESVQTQPSVTSPTVTSDAIVQRLSYLVQEREKQLESLTKANSTMMNENEQLRSDKERLEQELRAMQQSKDDVENLKVEFSQRLGNLERRLVSITKERDELKKNITSSDQSSLLRVKDEELAGLRMEGENLSKKQLTLEDTIKKLRAKQKEEEKTINNLREKLTNAEELLEQKIEKVKVLEQTERRQSETIANVKEIADSTSKKLQEKEKLLEQSVAKEQELQSTLERAWRELAEQKKINSGLGGQLEIKALEVEAKSKEEFQHLYKKLQAEYGEREAALTQSIQELRSSFARTTERAQWREEEFRKEIQELQAKCQEAEARNEELAASVADATRPLLRQIEALQTSHHVRQTGWDSLEKVLSERLKEQEEQTLRATDAERVAIMNLNEANMKLKMLESQVSSERTNNSRLLAELELTRSQLDEKQRSLQELLVQHNAAKTQLEKVLQEVKATEERYKKSLADARDREAQLLKERERDREVRDMSSSSSSASPAMSSQQMSKKSDNLINFALPSSSSYGGISSAQADRIQTLLRMKDGEIAVLQSQVASLEKTKMTLEDELVKFTTRNDELASQVAELQGIRVQMAELSQRYTLALEMMGEKEEMLEELKVDLMDTKSLYREQINELTLQLEQYQKQRR